MKTCIGACEGGTRHCPAPLTCSGSVPLVDESVELWRRDHLQGVEPVVPPRSVEGTLDEPIPRVNLLARLTQILLLAVAVACFAAFLNTVLKGSP